MYWSSPERAKQKTAKIRVSRYLQLHAVPLQGTGIKKTVPPERCPGLLCIVLSGLKLHNIIWLGSTVPKDAYQIQYTFRLRSTWSVCGDATVFEIRVDLTPSDNFHQQLLKNTRR
jgi:hypothetical protein